MDGFCGQTDWAGRTNWRTRIEHFRFVPLNSPYSRNSAAPQAATSVSLAWLVRSSIRTKLYSLVPRRSLAVGLAVGLGLYVQSRYGIGGPIYEQMAVQKEFLSEVEPAVLVPTLGYIAILELETEKDPVDIARTVQQYRAAEARVSASRETEASSSSAGGRSPPPSRARPHRPAEAMFALANARVHPPASSGPAARNPPIRTRSPALLREITRHFQERQASRQTGCISLTQDTVDAEKRDSGRTRTVLEQRQHHRQPPRGRVARPHQVRRRPQHRPGDRFAQRPGARTRQRRQRPHRPRSGHHARRTRPTRRRASTP